jgi:hypothetical protein
MMSLKIAKDVVGRIIALFLVSSLGIITGSSIINSVNPEVAMPLWYAAALAGFTAVADVVSKMARLALDGTITKEDVDLAFGVKTETREAVNALKESTVEVETETQEV